VQAHRLKVHLLGRPVWRWSCFGDEICFDRLAGERAASKETWAPEEKARLVAASLAERGTDGGASAPAKPSLDKLSLEVDSCSCEMKSLLFLWFVEH